MFLVISVIMAGAEGWQDIETYGDAKADWLRQYRPRVRARMNLDHISEGGTVAKQA
ncbi:hypothetical protein GCM10022421_13400 [Oceanisphaera sediminis]|uniref:H repeat-associated protein N-terminal domain-containing protein n=1 Tax=Oceanisphaera sediminis TaxID=981381 RepID=A0ABP7DQJ4_9GAMM